ncbi:MAG: hypothetical protein D6820_08825 [Lentisphaerae bacterium]|nr:MAG: hypothetical protein D6820_08825 [Lentisphaerota bacterium]
MEPAFKDIPALFLYDFPASMAALAVIDESRTPPVAQRWELYLYGIEVANTYTELTDREEHRRRFEEWNHYRQTHGLPVYPEDREFLDAVAKLPPCAGCAMGLERLLMGLTRRDEISFFRLFPDEPRRPSIP